MKYGLRRVGPWIFLYIQYILSRVVPVMTVCTLYIESVLLVKCYSPPPVNESGVFVPKKAYNIEYKTKSQICFYLQMDAATFLSVHFSRCPQKYMLYSTYLVRGGGGGGGQT
jgi:hypothetical protein